MQLVFGNNSKLMFTQCAVQQVYKNIFSFKVQLSFAIFNPAQALPRQHDYGLSDPLCVQEMNRQKTMKWLLLLFVGGKE
jgi:hypothetical protein